MASTLIVGWIEGVQGILLCRRRQSARNPTLFSVFGGCCGRCWISGREDDSSIISMGCPSIQPTKTKMLFSVTSVAPWLTSTNPHPVLLQNAFLRDLRGSVVNLYESPSGFTPKRFSLCPWCPSWLIFFSPLLSNHSPPFNPASTLDSKSAPTRTRTSQNPT